MPKAFVGLNRIKVLKLYDLDLFGPKFQNCFLNKLFIKPVELWV